MKKNILIYRDTLLPPSETFILAQGEGLSTFNPIYIGSRRVNGIQVPKDRSIFINEGGWIGKYREILFKIFDHIRAVQLEKIAALKPTLIHAHFGTDGVLACSLADALNVPLIVTFHGFDATIRDDYGKKSFFNHRKYIRRRQDLIQRGSKFIAVSDFIKGKLIEQGYPEDKILVHYIGIDTDIFRPVRETRRESIVLFVGRLVEKKGCAFLIRAMQKVQASFPDSELVVIGDGPLRKELENKAKKSLKKYRFLGVQSPSVVHYWMNRAKVFSVPSITAESGDAEGFGLVFAEAQAMGVPVVSFQSGGIPEAVSHGKSGFLLREKDWQGLAENIRFLLDDERTWQRISNAARQLIKRKFDLTKQNKILEQIYLDTLLGKKKTSKAVLMNLEFKT